jgi:hypothetical protein
MQIKKKRFKLLMLTEAAANCSFKLLKFKLLLTRASNSCPSLDTSEKQNEN